MVLIEKEAQCYVELLVHPGCGHILPMFSKYPGLLCEAKLALKEGGSLIVDLMN